MGYESMTDSGAGHSGGIDRQGRHGRSPDRHRQDGGFLLPLLQRLMRHENASASPARHPVRALVLLPTRELADQVAQQIALYAKHTKLRSTVVFGGMDMKPQTIELKKGVEVLVATPGRLLDHIEAKNVVLNQVEYVVLDEADRMLDIGFLPDLQRILLSAQEPHHAAVLGHVLARDQASGRQLSAGSGDHRGGRPNETASTVEQRFYKVTDDDKRYAIRSVLKERDIRQAFIFSNSKLGCARLTRALERDGLRAAALHGDKSQDERLKALEAFKAGEVDLLVCTDVAARGLDIKDVPAVFNYDVPFNAEDYVHRIGRTGRAGASGLAVTLVTDHDSRNVADIEKLIKKKIEVEPAPMLDFRPARRSRSDEEYRPRREREFDAASRGGRAHRPSRMAQRPVNLDPFLTSLTRPAAPARPHPGTASMQPRSRAQSIKPKRKIAALFKAPVVAS
jgi:superfamily II DNA/RNA helicase